jgi:lysophospholipase L1-like esterase
MSDIEAIAAAINELLASYGLTRDQMSDLLGGSADGGPEGNGKYPVTLANGDTVLVPCPSRIAVLSGDVSAAVATIQPILDASKVARTGAETARTGSETARGLSEAASVSAQKWAEGAGEPGGAGTKSAKAWAQSAAAAAAPPAILAAATAALGPINVFDPSKTTLGLLYNGNLLVGGYETYFTTDYIPVDDGGKITVSLAQPSADNGWAMSTYDKDKVYKGNVPYAANAAVQLAAGIRFVRFSQGNASKSSLMVSPGSALPASYRPFGLSSDPKQLAQMQALDVAHLRRRQGLFDPDLIKADTILRPDGAEAGYGSIYVSGYTPVTPGGKITLVTGSPGIGNPYGCAFYDKDKVAIPAGGLFGPFTPGQVINVPANGLYFRISLTADVLATFNILEGEQTPLRPSQHRSAFMADARPWAEKRIGFLGDSILAQGPTPQDVSKALGATLALNAVRSGRVMSAALYSAASQALTQADFANLDAVTLALGANDLMQGIPLGNLSDPAANTTGNYTASMKYAIETAQGWNKKMRIFLATMLPRNDWRTGSFGTAFAAFNQRVRDVAAIYSLPVIDLERKSGINDINMSVTLGDGLHPNSDGYTYFVTPCYTAEIAALRPSVTP